MGAEPPPAHAERLRVILSDYGGGLQTELTLLARLASLSDSQHAATEANDTSALTALSDERERTTRALIEVEVQLRPLRERLAANLDAVRRLPDFEPVTALHRRAEDAVTEILTRDRETLTALQDAERGRRLAARAIEAGEATLAAYRRIVAPPLSSAGIVSRRG